MNRQGSSELIRPFGEHSFLRLAGPWNRGFQREVAGRKVLLWATNNPTKLTAGLSKNSASGNGGRR
jgi:hypothetical protein